VRSSVQYGKGKVEDSRARPRISFVSAPAPALSFAHKTLFTTSIDQMFVGAKARESCSGPCTALSDEAMRSAAEAPWSRRTNSLDLLRTDRYTRAKIHTRKHTDARSKPQKLHCQANPAFSMPLAPSIQVNVDREGLTLVNFYSVQLSVAPTADLVSRVVNAVRGGRGGTCGAEVAAPLSPFSGIEFTAPIAHANGVERGEEEYPNSAVMLASGWFTGLQSRNGPSGCMLFMKMRGVAADATVGRRPAKLADCGMCFSGGGTAGSVCRRAWLAISCLQLSLIDGEPRADPASLASAQCAGGGSLTVMACSNSDVVNLIVTALLVILPAFRSDREFANCFCRSWAIQRGGTPAPHNPRCRMTVHTVLVTWSESSEFCRDFCD
jgi:hypothetical protein